MQYAIIKTGGKQYKVSPGTELEVEKIADLSPNIKFTEVLLVAGEATPQIGTPTIDGVYVEAELIANIKGPKIRSAVYKAKSRYRKVKGHRQPLTRVKIIRIVSENVAKRNPSVVPTKPKRSGTKGEKAKKIVKKK